MSTDLIASSEVPHTGTDKLRPPSIVATMIFIGSLKLGLRLVGFARTWEWIQRRAECVPLRNDMQQDAIGKAEYNVAMAAALYPGRALCLERSLTLYWHLRRHGVPVQYRMGVQMYPFMAHAWVEHRGVPINDVPEHVKTFRPIERGDR